MVSGFTHRQDGLDQVIGFSVTNMAGKDVVASGRLILLNVYDTSPPVSIPIDGLRIGAGETVTASSRWSGAPLLGQVRSLLVLNVGPGMTSVANFDFWIFPWQAFVILSGALVLSAGVFLALLRLRRRPKSAVPEGPGPEASMKLEEEKARKAAASQKRTKRPKRPKRRRYPSGMTGYVVEYGDTVVTIANRFGVTWEDIVRSNRLKPPYPLKPGTEILVPIHELQRPDREEEES